METLFKGKGFGCIDSFNLAKTHAFYTFMAKLKYGSNWSKRRIGALKAS